MNTDQIQHRCLLEIAVFNISSAIQAAAAGADRLELCENPLEGGTTPSYGTLKMVREKVDIPVFPIIRPRGGDFLFDGDSISAMEKDIALCKELGFEGIVTGMLSATGTVDEDQLKHLADLAYPMEVTFHRAFDRAANPFEAMEAVIRCGCSRILTSGQAPLAWDGRGLIKRLVDRAGDRIIIMPGSGIRAGNISELAGYTGATEMHSSARLENPSLMRFTNTAMEEHLTVLGVDMDNVREMKKALEQI